MSRLAHHQKIALEFSGGKDSMAVLYLLRHHLDRITVYHLNAGDQPQETKDAVDASRTFIPHFVEVKTDSRAWRRIHGDPSDVVGSGNTPLGVAFGFDDMPLVDRFSCCFANVMGPLHQRILADGNTLLIRGTKRCDMKRLPVHDGSFDGALELWLPIEHWTNDQVLDYLRAAGAPVHACYEKIRDGVECLTCTAWWEHRHLDWLSAAHPEAAATVAAKHIRIRAAVKRHMEALDA